MVRWFQRTSKTEEFNCDRCHQSVIDRLPVTEKLSRSQRQALWLCRQCVRFYEEKQLLTHESDEMILSRTLVCQICSMDLSASFQSTRLYCCRCENKLRLAARRIAFVHNCPIDNCW